MILMKVLSTSELYQIRRSYVHVGIRECRNGIPNLDVRWSNGMHTVCKNVSHLQIWVYC